MRRRRFLVILFGCIFVGIGGWLVWPGPEEPKYKGRALSEWLQLYQKRTTGDLSVSEIDDAPDAVRHIGANALPYLLKWVQPRPTSAELAVQYLPERLRESVIFRGFSERSDVRAEAAVSGFAILGPAARPAIPELVGLVTSAAPYPFAREALEGLGGDGLSALLAALVRPGQSNRLSILQCVDSRSTWPDPAAAFPPLIQCLDDPDRAIAVEAIRVIGRLGHGPDPALCALIKSLHHEDPLVRRAAGTALVDWRTAARPALPCLLRDLKNPRFASAAAEALGDLELEPQRVIPALTRALQNSDPIVRAAIARALGKFGEQARTAVPFLLELYNDPDDSMQRTALEALYAIRAMSFPFPDSEMFRRRYGLPPPPGRINE